MRRSKPLNKTKRYTRASNIIRFEEDIKFIRDPLKPVVILCGLWEARNSTKNQHGYGSLGWITALCHHYVVTLFLISAPRHKTTHCTAEAGFAVPFSNLSPLSHLSNAKHSRRPTEKQTVKERSPNVSVITTAVHTAGTATVRFSNFAAFLVTQQPKYSVDQHRSFSAHIYHAITVVMVVGDGSDGCIERRKVNDVSTDWFQDVEEK